jgi:non-specific serine/threonine protein kinase/serine/threonine-protein kinase
MGVVYEAEQTTPIHRRVALKVVRSGLDSKQVLARFETERQALALMDHPGIAKVFEAGTDDGGHPYFAMELVKGTPITEYCDLQKLSTTERIGLFAQVCRAVQHAHHKGVIHRDLKPSNVLVTTSDRQAVPKVIDFGIAKAVGVSLTDITVVTEHGQTIGTPEYMSPEQAEMSGLDVDTRSDIYSLGVMLYELLVGARPLDLREVASFALWHAIRERTPPTPSARLSTLPEGNQQKIAHHRDTDPLSLRRTLKGDLDWVVMTCLEKDRTRRYETATGLALDLERFLRHEPVVARPPSAAYRLRKFIRRHRAGVAATGIALLALVGGASAAVMGMLHARNAEERAIAEARTAEEVAEFMVGLFRMSGPDAARGDTITAREILDQGAKRVQTQLEGQPLLQGQLMTIMGSVYAELGLYREATGLLQGAYDVLTRTPDATPADVAEAVATLGVVKQKEGDLKEAESLKRRALQLRETSLGIGHEDVRTSLNDLATVLAEQGRYAEAKTLHERVLASLERLPGNNDSLLALSFNNLGVTLIHMDRRADAVPLLRRAMELWERAHGSDHPRVASALANLGGVQSDLGEYGEAERLLSRAIAIEQKILPEAHPNHGLRRYTLGAVYGDQKRYPEAERAYREALDHLERALGPAHPLVAACLFGIAQTHYQRRANFPEAERLLRRAIGIWENAGHAYTSQGLIQLAHVLARAGRPRPADSAYRAAVALAQRTTGSASTIAEWTEKYAATARELGRVSAADSLEARAREIREQEKAKGPTAPPKP